MKILTKEEEQAHYNATLRGGIGGGVAGLAVGLVGVYGAAQRYPAFRSLTLPLRAFLVTSSGTFAAIISADRYSRHFEKARHPEESYQDEAALQRAQAHANKSTFERIKLWGKENRYPIVGVSWLVSMAVAFGIVGRSPYLTTAQKIVQARVYAQGLTLAVLMATAAFEIGDKSEGQGRWETVKILDPNDPTHKHLIEKKIHHERYAGEDQWRGKFLILDSTVSLTLADMVEAEEKRIEERKNALREREADEAKKEKPSSEQQKSTSNERQKSKSKDEHAAHPKENEKRK